MDERPLGVMLAEPRWPKDYPHPSITKEIESLPVFQLFRHHMKDFEGGSRRENVAKDHTRRVCRLLFEIEESPTNIKPLWDNNKLNIIKNNFFKGNNLLEKDKRQTLKAYIILLRLFFKFIIARHEDIRQLETFDDNDLRLINSALTRLDSWPNALSDASNLRKSDIRKGDIDEKLTARYFQAFFDSPRATEIKQMFDDVATKENPTVGINDFTAMRDYLLLRVLMASGQRCGAASNLTIYEFSNGRWTESDKQRVYVTRTLCHKTSSEGPRSCYGTQNSRNTQTHTSRS